MKKFVLDMNLSDKDFNKVLNYYFRNSMDSSFYRTLVPIRYITLFLFVVYLLMFIDKLPKIHIIYLIVVLISLFVFIWNYLCQRKMKNEKVTDLRKLYSSSTVTVTDKSLNIDDGNNNLRFPLKNVTVESKKNYLYIFYYYKKHEFFIAIDKEKNSEIAEILEKNCYKAR